MLRDHGRIDVLVNNAGFAAAGFAEDMRLEEIRSQFETNFFGPVAMTQAVLPTMRGQRSGHIIMVSSISGLHGALTVSSYSAYKFALEGWSESLRFELNTLGIKVVLVEPGALRTNLGRATPSWEKNAIGDSQNRERGARMLEQITKLPKRDPIVVARLIAKVAQKQNPRLRYLVGPDAHVQLWLKRLLPWKWHEKLVARFCGSIERDGGEKQIPLLLSSCKHYSNCARNDKGWEYLLCVQIHCLYRQVPMCVEDFETALLFLGVGFLVGK